MGYTLMSGELIGTTSAVTVDIFGVSRLTHISDGLVLQSRDDQSFDITLLVRVGKALRAGWISFQGFQYFRDGLVEVTVTGFGVASPNDNQVVTGNKSNFRLLQVILDDGKPRILLDPMAHLGNYQYHTAGSLESGPWSVFDPNSPIPVSEPTRFFRWKVVLSDLMKEELRTKLP